MIHAQYSSLLLTLPKDHTGVVHVTLRKAESFVPRPPLHCLQENLPP
jgi:hypothetical protein